jgi:RND family efflux transporter MFP subunit
MTQRNLPLAILLLLGVTIAGSPAIAQRPNARSPMIAVGAALDGVIEPNVISNVATVETGTVKEILVKLGDRVKVGQPLVQLDTGRLEKEIELAAREAESRGRLDAVEADLELNERKVAKLRELFQSKKGSFNELEQAETEYKVAKGKVLAEQDAIQIVLNQVEKLNMQLSMRTIRSPIDGVVVELHKQLGEFVSNNTPHVVRIIDDSRLRARIMVQPSDIVKLPTNRKAKIELPDGQMVNADVEYIATTADGESGCITVIVSFDNVDGKILWHKCRLVLQ